MFHAIQISEFSVYRCTASSQIVASIHNFTAFHYIPVYTVPSFDKMAGRKIATPPTCNLQLFTNIANDEYKH